MDSEDTVVRGMKVYAVFGVDLVEEWFVDVYADETSARSTASTLMAAADKYDSPVRYVVRELELK